jgi:oligoxyloglucan reducing-end-specific cellobiohydrolase
MEEPYDVRSISFGKGKDENSEPVLYFLGKLGGKDGVFASEDMGKSFLRLNTDDNKLGKGNFISGDRRCYGRCFIGTGGRGIIIGHI